MVQDSTKAATDRRWVLGATVITVLLLTCLLFRAFQLQVLQADRHKQNSLDRSLVQVRITPARGRILDRTGVSLAEPRESFDAHVLQHRRHEASFWESVRARLDLRTKRLDRIRTFLDGQATRQPRFIRIARGLTREQAQAVRNDPSLRWRLKLESVEARRYPIGLPFAHVVGTLGEVDRDDLAHHPERGYRAGDRNGRSGIEAAFESKLRGQPGFKWVPANRRVRVAIEARVAAEASPGEDVHTTLDANLQRGIHEAFDRAQEAFGAAVVLDVSTGGVRALYSRPAVDPNLFERSVSSEQANAMLSDPKRPLLNRALAVSYVAGAVLEPFLLAHADRPEPATSELARFGFGQPTGIELTPEATGALAETLRETSATALQVARAYAALSNGGWLHQVGLLQPDEPSSPQSLRLGPELLNRAAHTLSVLRPTQDQGFVEPSTEHPSVRVLSATGSARPSATRTAQTDCAWVVGFAPATEPRIAFAIVVEAPTTPASARSIAARVLSAGAARDWWSGSKGATR